MKRLWIFIVTVFILGGLFFTIPSQEVKAARKKPAKVTKLKVTNVDYDTLKITWKKVASAKKYEVYRAISKNGKYKKIKTISAKKYTNKGLTTGTKYFYKVRARKGSKKGTFSAKKSGTPMLKNSSNITVTMQSSSSATISWTPVNGATGYEVYRSQSAKGTYQKIGTVTATSYNDSELSAGQQYFYKVRAYRVVNNTNQYGTYSNVVSCQTPMDVATIQEQMLSAVNKERAKVGVAPLKLYNPINETSQVKAKDMYQTGVFSHYSETLGYFYNQYDNAGLFYMAGGENIAMGQDSVASVMNSWMNSEGHRENILNEKYTYLGVGYYNGYWVQQFLTLFE